MAVDEFWVDRRIGGLEKYVVETNRENRVDRRIGGLESHSN